MTDRAIIRRSKQNLFGKESNESSNQQKEDYDECDELDAEIKSIFDELRLVGSSQNYSLDEVLEKALIEEKEFTKWKQSGKPLENIRFFQNTNDKLKPLAVEKVSANKTLEDTFECKITENSQFEIWECDKDKDNSRQFPLYRILLSKIINENKLVINEQLRKDFTLNIEAERTEDSLSFKVSFPSFIVENKEKVRVPNFISTTLNTYYKFKDSTGFFMWEAYNFWLKKFQRLQFREVAASFSILIICLIIAEFILPLESSAQVNKAIKQKSIIKDEVFLTVECNRQQCNDPEYMKKTNETYDLTYVKEEVSYKEEKDKNKSTQSSEKTTSPTKAFKNIDKPKQINTKPKKNTKWQSSITTVSNKVDESEDSLASTNITSAKVNSPTDGFLALRTNPNAIANKIMEIPNGSSIKVSDCLESVMKKSGRWCQVTYNGNSGWVNNRFLTF
jgi:hypothetical protein